MQSLIIGPLQNKIAAAQSPDARTSSAHRKRGVSAPFNHSRICVISEQSSKSRQPREAFRKELLLHPWSCSRDTDAVERALARNFCFGDIDTTARDQPTKLCREVLVRLLGIRLRWQGSNLNIVTACAARLACRIAHCSNGCCWRRVGRDCTLIIHCRNNFHRLIRWPRTGNRCLRFCGGRSWRRVYRCGAGNWRGFRNVDIRKLCRLSRNGSCLRWLCQRLVRGNLCFCPSQSKPALEFQACRNFLDLLDQSAIRPHDHGLDLAWHDSQLILRVCSICSICSLLRKQAGIFSLPDRREVASRPSPSVSMEAFPASSAPHRQAARPTKSETIASAHPAFQSQRDRKPPCPGSEQSAARIFRSDLHGCVSAAITTGAPSPVSFDPWLA